MVDVLLERGIWGGKVQKIVSGSPILKYTSTLVFVVPRLLLSLLPYVLEEDEKKRSFSKAQSPCVKFIYKKFPRIISA